MLYSLSLVVLTIIGVAIPFASGKVIDALAYNYPPFTCFLALSALLIFRTVLNPVLQRFICSCSRTVEADLQFRVLEVTMNLSPAQLEALANGELVAKLTRDAYAVGSFVRGFYPRILEAVVMMFAAGCALFVRSSVLAVAFMALFPLVIILFAPFARKFSVNSHLVRQQGDTSFTSLFNFLMTLPMLRILSAERRFAEVPHNALNELKAGNDETDRISVAFGLSLGALLVGGEIAVLGFAGMLAAKGSIPVGDVVLYQMLFITAIQSVQGVVSLLPELASIREGADSLCEVFSLAPPKDGNCRVENLECISFEHVTFAYSGASERPIVRDFSATFRTGTVVGLSGVNGAGKTTLLKLAVNALEPQSGVILVNRLPFDEIDLKAFRRRIGIVSQDNLLVAGTIRDNITLRDSSFTEEDIDRAIDLSGFGAVVKRLPDGIDTFVGNNIRNLSGGERQRLAIARAIIRDPFILVLDEATNHLDSESRESFAKLVARLRHGRLILLVSHDEELRQLCDIQIPCQVQSCGSNLSICSGRVSATL